MATYITTIKFTQGLGRINETTKRAASFRHAQEDRRQCHEHLLDAGAYDGLLIC